jgi:hypothetical protein
MSKNKRVPRGAASARARVLVNRRGLLGGAAGVFLGLPLLESLLPRSAAAAPPVKRFIVFFTCNGVNRDTFWPATDYGPLTDASFAGDRALAALSAYRSKLLIPRGMHMVPRGFGLDPGAGGDHAKGMGCKLTAQPLIEGSEYAGGISVDQAIAAKNNPPDTPALTLMVGPRDQGAKNHISYTGSEQPVMGENNPRLAYEDLVGVSTLEPEEAHQLRVRRASVLDLVRPEYDALLGKKRLGKADREKLDRHFTAVRALEVRLGDHVVACGLAPDRAAEVQGVDASRVGYDAEYKAMGEMQMDVLALAIACGATSSASLQWGTGAGGPIFTWDGMNHAYNHHKLSHGNTSDDDKGAPVAGYRDMLRDIDAWYATQLAYLLDRLSSYEEGGGATALDNSLVLWANEMTHGESHDFRDMPVVIAGSAGGYLKQGQYLKVTKQRDTRNDVDAPHNKLLTTCMNAMGVPATNFGSFGEPGEFDELKA